MTSQEFRVNGAMVKRMREIVNDPIFQLAVEITEAEGPMKRRENGDPNRILGRIEGYDDRLVKLKLMGEYAQERNVDNDEVVDKEEANA